MEVYYFHVHYGYDYEGWKEKDEYGFLLASNFIHAMNQIVEYYRDDLLSVKISQLGDTGIISIENEEVAEAFRKSFLKTHYEEDEE